MVITAQVKHHILGSQDSSNLAAHQMVRCELMVWASFSNRAAGHGLGRSISRLTIKKAALMAANAELTHAHAQNIDQAPALIKSTQFYVPQPGLGPGHYIVE